MLLEAKLAQEWEGHGGRVLKGLGLGTVLDLINTKKLLHARFVNPSASRICQPRTGIGTIPMLDLDFGPVTSNMTGGRPLRQGQIFTENASMYIKFCRLP